MANVLVKRRAKRGRPRIEEVKNRAKMKSVPVFIARDPQGIKLFKGKPALSVSGVWEGQPINGTKPMDPRTFVMKFRNAVLPIRGKYIQMRMGV